MRRAIRPAIRRNGFFLEGEGVFTNVILRRERLGVKSQVGVVLLFCGLVLFTGCSETKTGGDEGVSLNIETEQPTPIRFEGQATPVLLPHTNLYIFLTSSRPLYFRDGKYYQFYRDNWFRSEDLNGPWEQIDPIEIPDLLQNLPPDYYYNNFPYKLQKER